MGSPRFPGEPPEIRLTSKHKSSRYQYCHLYDSSSLTLNTSRPIPLANQRKSTKCSFFVSALHKLGSPRFPGFPDGPSIGVFYFVKKSCNFQKKRFWFVIYLQYIEYSPRKKRNRFIEATTSFQGPKRGLGNPRGTLILFLGNPGNLFVPFWTRKSMFFRFSDKK